MAKFGWIYHNDDTGLEWSDDHPIKSGEVLDAKNIRPCTQREWIWIKQLIRVSKENSIIKQDMKELLKVVQPFYERIPEVVYKQTDETLVATAGIELGTFRALKTVIENITSRKR